MYMYTHIRICCVLVLAIDFCVGVNCSGNGRCDSVATSFVCVCDPGYTGEMCETGSLALIKSYLEIKRQIMYMYVYCM